jgi:putative transposase
LRPGLLPFRTDLSGGIETHVHVVVSIPPTLVVADWIGRLKGASSHYVNHRLANRKLLEWQTGYGVVSFGTKDLHWVIKYVRNQKLHHANGTTALRLEMTNDEES